MARQRSGRLVTIFGGSGFVGRHLVRALARDGWRIIVACRRPDLANYLLPNGQPGQVNLVQANLRHPESIAAAVNNAQAVVNLTGILAESGRQTFEAIHRNGAAEVAKATKAAGIKTLVHMSAIGADPNANAHYAATKGLGEAAVYAAFPDAVVIRPSIVYGPEDSFFNRFATLARISPVLPLIGGGQSKMQPVFVGDVAKAMALAVDGKTRTGQIYELGGDEIYSFETLMQMVCDMIMRKRHLLSLSFSMAHLQGVLSEVLTKCSLGLYPETLRLTRDQVEMLKQDNVVSAQAVQEGRTLAGLGLKAETVEAIVPSYLYRFRKMGQFERQNDRAVALQASGLKPRS